MDGSGSNVGEGREQVTTDVVALGDVIFVKPQGGSWWPALVVDKNTVAKSARPGERSAGKVRVRLYGSSQYLYVDPIKCRFEFEKILNQHNGSYREIFQQSLAKALPSSKPSKSKRPGSQTKGKEKVKRLKQSNVAQNMEYQIEVLDDNNLCSQSPVTEIASEGTSQELSERRVRVMSKLGLAAPPGSPFTKD
ncbi:hypothetical protein QN277_017439 [Acacia crassicarpa]|uniref:PWWP domain-containing protein n=1 Tax=Acacia crassicarpa TaxID=499986 RepID=A0AAE1JU13_9FABA|nr:hypothetical protein QN277_017439 [Acacia crassicarpa]